MPKGVYKRDPNSKLYNSRKLSQKDDVLISSLYKKGFSQKDLGLKFDCDRRCIHRSLKRTKTHIESHRGLPGKKNPAWKGGRIVDKSGYILIQCPGNPMANSQGYVRKHRLVMSKILNRPLKKEEVVHHKNGDHSDNDPKNLLLFSNNGVHLGVELLGKTPKWTQDGLDRIASRSIPSMKGTVQCQRGTGVRKSRKKLIQKFLHETSDLQDTGPVAELLLPKMNRRKSKKKR